MVDSLDEGGHSLDEAPAGGLHGSTDLFLAGEATWPCAHIPWSHANSTTLEPKLAFFMFWCGPETAAQ